LQSLKGEKFRCAHGILRVQPCEKCGRLPEDCAAYRPSTQAHFKQVLLESGVTKSPKEALMVAKALLDMPTP
jgi:hypothetical protein